MEKKEKIFCDYSLKKNCVSCDYLDAVYFDGDIMLRCFKTKKLLRWYFGCYSEDID